MGELSAALEPGLLAEPDRGFPAPSGLADSREEPLDRMAPESLLHGPLDRVERVAAKELEVEAGEDVRAADIVEADELAGDSDQRAGLPVEPRQRLSVLVERRAAVVIERLGGASRRVGVQPSLLGGDLAPDLALVEGAGEVARAAQRRVRRARRGRKATAPVRPAPLLDAGDGDLER